MVSRRYFRIEPKYANWDVFCRFKVGSKHVRASIDIYADMEMLYDVAAALTASRLEKATTVFPGPRDERDDWIFGFFLTVQPHEGTDKRLRIRVFQGGLDDGAPYRADICFEFTSVEAEEFAQKLRAWCDKPDYVFSWEAYRHRMGKADSK